MKKTLLSLLVLLLCSQLASATTILVPGNQPTIQAGINAASTGDTVLVADDTYSGVGNYNLDFYGREIVVMSENGPDNCTINCLGSGRGIYFHTGETSSSVFEGFTITAGNTGTGGGINVTNSSPLILRCIIANNYGAYGGGIYISNGSPSIIKCTIASNAASNGGAIYFTSSSPLISSCIIVSNTASG